MARRAATMRTFRASAEALERRTLLSLSPAGPEFRVNTSTVNVQNQASTAMDGDGDFVVAWISDQDGSSYDIYAQRYNAAGVAQGGEFRVNTYTTDFQSRPSVAMDAGGDFVVAWQSYRQDGSSFGVYAQRYDAAGIAQGAEFRVNSFATGNQSAPSVAMDAAGDVVVTWQSVGQDGSGRGVYAQRYNAAGAAQGGEFRVNSFTTDDQGSPTVAVNARGDFVVAWHSLGQDGSSFGVYAQRYNASGAAQGSEFRVNTFTTGNQNTTAVAMDAAGDFVITWASPQSGSPYDVYAQRYNAAGVAQGGEFQVNTYTTSNQGGQTVAMDAAGNFVVTWLSYGQDGSNYGAYARRYNAAGVAQGAEFRVNTYTTERQGFPSVAADAAGDFVVAWRSYGQDGSSYGIYAQRYDESTDTAAPVISGVFVNGKRALPYTAQAGPVGQIVVGFSENVLDTGGPSSVTNPANWRVTYHNGTATSNVPLPHISYFFNATANRFEATLQLSSSFATGNLQVMALDNIRDASGNALDGNLDGLPGGSTSLTFGIGASLPRGGEFRVNSYTTSRQTDSSVAMDAAGDYVVAWDSEGQDGSGLGIYAQRYNAAGVAQGAEFRVNSFTTGSQISPSVAMDTIGDFVVIWQSGGQDGSEFGIYGQRYNAAGVAQGAEFRVNSFTTGRQASPSVAMDAVGEFVVAWHSDGQDGSSKGVYAQRYNALGVAQGVEFRVNSFTTFDQGFPSVAMDAAGKVVVTWQSDGQDGSSYGVYAQRYNVAGVAQGGEVRVNSFTTNGQGSASVAMDAVGDYVVAWRSYGQDGSGYGVYAQRYNAGGAAQGVEFRANSFTTSYQLFSRVAMDVVGEFVVVWHSIGQDGSGYGIYAQRYTTAGVPQGAEFQVNSFTTSSQGAPLVAMDSVGDFVVAWRSYAQDGDNYGIYAQRYNVGATPIVGALSDTPDPIIPGAPITLTASAVTDDMFVLSMRFYREANGIGGLQFGPGGDSLIGTDDNGGDGWSVVVSSPALPGTSLYYAQAADDEGLVGAPATTTHTVVDAAPNITAAKFYYQTGPQRLTFTFDQNVSASLSEADIASIGTPGVDYVISYDADTNTAIITFNHIIADGNYTATVVASGVTSASGTPMTSNYPLSFFFLGGDANHDRHVDVTDLGILATNWQGTGKTFADADFNYDGVVNVTDLGILATNWQKSVAPPSLAFAATASPARRATGRPSLADQILS